LPSALVGAQSSYWFSRSPYSDRYFPLPLGSERPLTFRHFIFFFPDFFLSFCPYLQSPSLFPPSAILVVHCLRHGLTTIHPPRSSPRCRWAFVSFGGLLFSLLDTEPCFFFFFPPTFFNRERLGGLPEGPPLRVPVVVDRPPQARSLVSSCVRQDSHPVAASFSFFPDTRRPFFP